MVVCNSLGFVNCHKAFQLFKLTHRMARRRLYFPDSESISSSTECAVRAYANAIIPSFTVNAVAGCCALKVYFVENDVERLDPGHR